MAVAFDAKASANAGTFATDASTLDLTTMTIGSGLTNGALVVMILFGNTGVVPTMTWDSGGGKPQPMTQIGTTNNSTIVRADLWGLLAPNPGNKTLHVTWTGGNSSCIMDAVSYSGVHPAAVSTSFPNYTGATGTSNTASVTITSASDDAVVACGCSNPAQANSTNNTNVFTSVDSVSINAWGNRASGAASAAMTAALNVSAPWVQVGCDLLAATYSLTYHKSLTISI